MKKIIILMLAFLLSGCTVNYELEIFEDLSLKESITVLDYASYFNRSGDVLTQYKKIVDIGMNEKNIYNYEYIEKKDKNLYGGQAFNHYKSLYDFKENAISYKDAFDDIEIEEYDSIITLKSVGDFKVESFVKFNESEAIDELVPENTYFSLIIPFEVIEHNADRVDTEKNIYYWDIDLNTTEDKNIIISFNKNKKHISFTKILSKIDYTFLIIIVIIILFIIIGYNSYKKSLENNRI